MQLQNPTVQEAQLKAENTAPIALRGAGTGPV
jgi:hypothetical protein